MLDAYGNPITTPISQGHAQINAPRGHNMFGQPYYAQQPTAQNGPAPNQADVVNNQMSRTRDQLAAPVMSPDMRNRLMTLAQQAGRVPTGMPQGTQPTGFLPGGSNQQAIGNMLAQLAMRRRARPS